MEAVLYGGRVERHSSVYTSSYLPTCCLAAAAAVLLLPAATRHGTKHCIGLKNMKVVSICAMRYNRDTAEPVMLSQVNELASFGFFQRQG